MYCRREDYRRRVGGGWGGWRGMERPTSSGATDWSDRPGRLLVPQWVERVQGRSGGRGARSGNREATIGPQASILAGVKVPARGGRRRRRKRLGISIGFYLSLPLPQPQSLPLPSITTYPRGEAHCYYYLPLSLLLLPHCHCYYNVPVWGGAKHHRRPFQMFRQIRIRPPL